MIKDTYSADGRYREILSYDDYSGVLMLREYYKDGVQIDYKTYYANGMVNDHQFSPDNYATIKVTNYLGGQTGSYARYTWKILSGHTQYRQVFQNGQMKCWYPNGMVENHSFYRDGKKVANLTVRIVMSLLYFKQRWRKYTRERLRRKYLDDNGNGGVISDLGNIVMLYWFKG